MVGRTVRGRARLQRRGYESALKVVGAVGEVNVLVYGAPTQPFFYLDQDNFKPFQRGDSIH